mmetsp:Transcript_15592/g.45002  ORF Transcript_15592/g.45002 Transcript_15592/m.45002 type:complete len:357 (+) Transcript_15592:610-1680(+)
MAIEEAFGGDPSMLGARRMLPASPHDRQKSWCRRECRGRRGVGSLGSGGRWRSMRAPQLAGNDPGRQDAIGAARCARRSRLLVAHRAAVTLRRVLLWRRGHLRGGGGKGGVAEGLRRSALLLGSLGGGAPAALGDAAQLPSGVSRALVEQLGDVDVGATRPDTVQVQRPHGPRAAHACLAAATAGASTPTLPRPSALPHHTGLLQDTAREVVLEVAQAPHPAVNLGRFRPRGGYARLGVALREGHGALRGLPKPTGLQASGFGGTQPGAGAGRRTFALRNIGDDLQQGRRQRLETHGHGFLSGNNERATQAAENLSNGGINGAVVRHAVGRLAASRASTDSSAMLLEFFCRCLAPD